MPAHIATPHPASAREPTLPIVSLLAGGPSIASLQMPPARGVALSYQYDASPPAGVRSSRRALLLAGRTKAALTAYASSLTQRAQARMRASYLLSVLVTLSGAALLTLKRAW